MRELVAIQNYTTPKGIHIPKGSVIYRGKGNKIVCLFNEKRVYIHEEDIKVYFKPKIPVL